MNFKLGCVIAFVAVTLLVVIIAACYMQSRIITFPYNIAINRVLKSLNRKKPFLDKNELFPQFLEFEKNTKLIKNKLLEVMKNESKIPLFQEVEK